MSKSIEEISPVFKKSLEKAYSQGVQHCIDTVKSYHNIIQSQVVDLILEKIIEDLKKLK